MYDLTIKEHTMRSYLNSCLQSSAGFASGQRITKKILTASTAKTIDFILISIIGLTGSIFGLLYLFQLLQKKKFKSSGVIIDVMSEEF
jgi:hypothetical protein